MKNYIVSNNNIYIVHFIEVTQNTELQDKHTFNFLDNSARQLMYDEQLAI